MTEESLESEPLEEKAKTSPVAKFFGLLWSGVALITILSYWQNPLLLTLISSFRFQLLVTLFVVSVPPLLLFAGRKKFLFLAVPLAVAVTFLSYLVPVYQESDPSKSTLEIVVSNVYVGNPDIRGLSSWLEGQETDILVVLEVGPHHVQALKDFGLENQTIEARTNAFGLALLSKEAPLSVEVLEGESSFPSILAEFQNFRVLATHPIPPFDKETRQTGDEQMIRLAKLAGKSSKPTLMVGDFNATGWDMRLRPLEEMGLKDSRKGHGLIPTWPVGRPFMHIPIDHIFIPKAWTSLECKRGPNIGSDHYPLRATLQY